MSELNPKPESIDFEGCVQEAIELAVADICTAARDLFDLHPGHANSR